MLDAGCGFAAACGFAASGTYRTDPVDYVRRVLIHYVEFQHRLDASPAIEP